MRQKKYIKLLNYIYPIDMTSRTLFPQLNKIFGRIVKSNPTIVLSYFFFSFFSYRKLKLVNDRAHINYLSISFRYEIESVLLIFFFDLRNMTIHVRQHD